MDLEELYNKKPQAFENLLDRLIDAQINILEMKELNALKVDTSFSKNKVNWNTPKGKVVYNFDTGRVDMYGFSNTQKSQIITLFHRWYKEVIKNQFLS